MSLFKNLRPIFVSRSFRKWINTVFNKVDYARIKEVGADQAAAEWLLRCGASVRWKDDNKFIVDYNELLKLQDSKHKIIEIDATESCIMHIGFPYLGGLKHLKSLKLKKCIYLEDKCLASLAVVKNSLEHLEVISCGNVSDQGILSLSELKRLKKLYLFDLPEVKNKEHCLCELKKSLSTCHIAFPSID